MSLPDIINIVGNFIDQYNTETYGKSLGKKHEFLNFSVEIKLDSENEGTEKNFFILVKCNGMKSMQYFFNTTKIIKVISTTDNKYQVSYKEEFHPFRKDESGIYIEIKDDGTGKNLINITVNDSVTI